MSTLLPLLRVGSEGRAGIYLDIVKILIISHYGSCRVNISIKIIRLLNKALVLLAFRMLYNCLANNNVIRDMKLYFGIHQTYQT